MDPDEFKNVWVYDGSYNKGNVKQTSVTSDVQERERKENAERVVTIRVQQLRSMYTPRIANEYIAAMFRQRGVPSVDMFTYNLILSFRSSLGLEPTVEDTLRRIIKLGTWSTTDTKVTMGTIEPVIASMYNEGNSIDVAGAKERFSANIQVVDPLTMTTHTNTVIGNQIRGRQAGWLTWMEYLRTGGGTSSCISCNMCGPSIMFAVHTRGSKMMQMKMTPESIISLSTTLVRFLYLSA